MIIPIIFLLNKKMGLRIRQEDQELTLTLKTNGKVVSGLHSRPEYNLPLIEKETPTNAQLRGLYPLNNYLALHYNLFSPQILTALFG